MPAVLPMFPSLISHDRTVSTGFLAGTIAVHWQLAPSFRGTPNAERGRGDREEPRGEGRHREALRAVESVKTTGRIKTAREASRSRQLDQASQPHKRQEMTIIEGSTQDRRLATTAPRCGASIPKMGAEARDTGPKAEYAPGRRGLRQRLLDYKQRAPRSSSLPPPRAPRPRHAQPSRHQEERRRPGRLPEP